MSQNVAKPMANYTSKFTTLASFMGICSQVVSYSALPGPFENKPNICTCLTGGNVQIQTNNGITKNYLSTIHWLLGIPQNISN